MWDIKQQEQRLSLTLLPAIESLPLAGLSGQASVGDNAWPTATDVPGWDSTQVDFPFSEEKGGDGRRGGQGYDQDVK